MTHQFTRRASAHFVDRKATTAQHRDMRWQLEQEEVSNGDVEAVEELVRSQVAAATQLKTIP